jgi:HD-GYP domain-containing protein (c-di-GMP phosphodiesterase class II)
MTVSSTTRVAETRSISNQITAVLHNLVAERDLELADHEGRVARLAQSVAPELGMPDEQTPALVQAAYLHDVGKLALPEILLCTPRALDEEEWRLVRQHTLVGDRILRAAGALPQAAAFVRSSHERFDGGGYPDGLAAEQIPLGARIIAVCDAYDAMTSPRPYRTTAMSDEAAIVELRRWSGTQFDPAVVTAVCALSATDRRDLEERARQDSNL